MNEGVEQGGLKFINENGNGLGDIKNSTGANLTQAIGDDGEISQEQLENLDKVLDSDYVDMIFKIGTNVGAGNSGWLGHILPELIKTRQVSSELLRDLFRSTFLGENNSNQHIDLDYIGIWHAMISTGQIEDESIQKICRDLSTMPERFNIFTGMIIQSLIHFGQIPKERFTNELYEELVLWIELRNIGAMESLKVLIDERIFDDEVEKLGYLVSRPECFRGLDDKQVSYIQNLYDIGKFKGTLYEGAIKSLLFDEDNEKKGKRVLSDDDYHGMISKAEIHRRTIMEKLDAGKLEINNIFVVGIVTMIDERIFSDEDINKLYETFINDIIYKNELKITILVKLLYSFIKSGKIYKENLNRSFNKFFEGFKVSSSKWSNLLIILFKSGLMGSFQSDMLFKYIIEKSNIDIFSGNEYLLVSAIADYFDFSDNMIKEFIYNYPNYLDKFGACIPVLLALFKKGKIDRGMANLLFDSIYEHFGSDFSQCFDSLEIVIDSGMISSYRLNKIFDEMLDRSIEGNDNCQRLLAKLIKTGKIKILQEKGNFGEDKMSSSVFENYRIVEQIMRYTKGNYIKLFRYLRKIIFDKEKLEDIRDFLMGNINVYFFTKYIEQIVMYGENKGLNFGYFKVALREGIHDRDIFEGEEGVSSTSKYKKISIYNFFDYLEEDEPLFEFEKDKGIEFETVPWSPKWFKENEKRLSYLNSDKIKTFEKFGTIIALGILEGCTDHRGMKKFYENIFSNISYSENRSSMLQLGEVFNIVLADGKYELFSEIVENSEVGEYFKDFVEDYSLCEKGRTILTLMFVREIRDSFQIYNDIKGKEKVEYSKIEDMIMRVYEKLKKYREMIDIYKDIPVKTSIGMEYEVTESIAKGYKEEIGSDYKNDITILSSYGNVGRGNDAVHEIATRPTNNPYLLILEMKLLEDLDFLDLNFKKEDYERGSRGLHITVGGEYGIRLEGLTNFVQNILIGSNLGGVNAGEEVIGINHYSNIREKGSDSETLFGEHTECTEFRALGIDKKEQFERMILSSFELSMAIQVVKNYLGDDFFSFNFVPKIERELLTDIDTFKEFIKNHGLLIKELEDDNIYKLIYDFIVFMQDIIEIVEYHNANFSQSESTEVGDNEVIENLIFLITSTNPFVKIMGDIGISINYFKKLYEGESKGVTLKTQNQFEQKLEKDGKEVSKLTERQREILFKGYKVRIRKSLKKLSEQNGDIYENLDEYLNGNTEDTVRKITNRKRFNEVLASLETASNSYEQYMQIIQLEILNLFKGVDTEFVNIFTRINNLFIKRDSTNALSMLDSTREEDGTVLTDGRLAESTIFDKIDMGLLERKGEYVIQGASERMIVSGIQRRILEFVYRNRK